MLEAEKKKINSKVIWSAKYQTKYFLGNISPRKDWNGGPDEDKVLEGGTPIQKLMGVLEGNS